MLIFFTSCCATTTSEKHSKIADVKINLIFFMFVELFTVCIGCFSKVQRFHFFCRKEKFLVLIKIRNNRVYRHFYVQMA
jgi:hypothetical protein